MSRALDALVAERVLGWTMLSVLDQDGIPRGYPPAGEVICAGARVPPYTTDIAAAWSVAMKFISAGCAAWVSGDGHTGYSAGCTSAYLLDKAKAAGEPTEGIAVRFEAECCDSAPLAICLAALRAVGVPEDEIQAARGGSDG